MELDQVPTRRAQVRLAGLPRQFPGWDFSGWRGLLFLGFALREADGKVALLKSRDLVVVRICGIGLMSRTIAKVKMERVWAFTDQNTLSCHRNGGCGRIGDVSDKHTLPQCRPIGAFHILHVKHKLGKAFVKYSGLNFKGYLRGLEAFLQSSQRGL